MSLDCLLYWQVLPIAYFILEGFGKGLDVAQLRECLSSTHKALDSIPRVGEPSTVEAGRTYIRCLWSSSVTQ